MWAWLTTALLLLGVVAGRASAQQAGRALAQAPAPAQASVPQAGRVGAACAQCHRDAGPSRSAALAHAPGATCLTCHHLGFTNDPSEAAARREEACRSCHKTLTPTHAAVRGNAPGCQACHRLHDDGRMPAAKAAIAGRCESCHAAPHKLHAAVTKNAPRCTDCHTAHDAHGATALKASPAAASAACASCHRSPHPAHDTVTAIAQCTSCHKLNEARVAAGPQLTATCQSCHRTHPAAHASVKSRTMACTDCHDFGKDPKLPQAAVAISERCGACHIPELGAYQTGAHAKGMAAKGADGDLPTCVTCHTVHDPQVVGSKAVRVAATTRCIQCHSEGGVATKHGKPASVGKTFVRDFHGETVSFLANGKKVQAHDSVMTCSDCHGAHDVARKRQAEVAAVCVRCHKDDPKIASAWLGHTPVGPRSQPLIWLIKLFYYFLIPFELLGLTIHIFFQLRDQKRHGARVLHTEKMERLRAWLARRPEPKPTTVKRFSLRERLEHVGGMTTFILLVVTGLPQIRPDIAVARDIIALFGGIQWTRYVHRTIGVIFVLLMVIHATRAVVCAIRSRRMPIMVPVRKDFEDALQTVKHYLMGAPRPKAAKFDASEKFEYWGLLLGGTLMCVTGLGLLFPEQVTSVLPGIVVAMFRTLHGLEATFAVCVIVLWHSYGVILRPEVFPLDTSIFSGDITVERLKEEHGAEYERLFPGRSADEEEEEEEEELAIAD